MIYNEKPKTVEAFHMTKAAYRDQESWPDWVKDAWELDTTDMGSFHCLHQDRDQLRVRTQNGLSHVSFGYYLISPQWNSCCCIGIGAVMSTVKFESLYEVV